MSISFADAAKAKKLRDFFQQHGRIYIVVDATSDAVEVPDFLKGDPALRLVLNVRMPQPIHIREDVLESDLSFSGRVHHCRIPMSQVWAAYLPDESMEHGIVWDEDVPETIRTVIQAVRGLGEEADEEAEIHVTAEKPSAADENPASSGGRKVGHLRVIK